MDYQGITVAEDTALRTEMRKEGVDYTVVKNTLTRIAIDKFGNNTKRGQQSTEIYYLPDNENSTVNGFTQQDLTMRVLEGMECHKKIITTNDYISHYDFYNTEDFFCLDPKAIHLDKARIQSPTTYTFDESSFTVASFVRGLVLSQEVNA